MGKVDILTKEYMSDNAVFADAFNYLLYDGKMGIQENERFHHMDMEAIRVINSLTRSKIKIIEAKQIIR